jgi:GT2 family glycosyltransferase
VLEGKSETQSAPAHAESRGIDVVIVTADTREMVLECLASLGDVEGLHISLVDNDSHDGTAEEVRSRFGEAVTVTRLEQSTGFARACNIGARTGTAPLVLFLNSDIVAQPGSIERVRAALDADPAAVAAGGRLVDPGTSDTQARYRPRRFPSAISLAAVISGVESRWPENPVSRRYHGLDLREDVTQAVSQPAAAALMVEREALERVGGFDERFWFWFEDSDLLRRLSRLGRVLWVPTAPFEHLGGASFSRWDRVREIRSLYHGMLHYADAHFGWPGRVLVGGLTVAVSLAWSVLLRRRRPEEARAWRDVGRAGWRLLIKGEVPAIAGPGSTG